MTVVAFPLQRSADRELEWQFEALDLERVRRWLRDEPHPQGLRVQPRDVVALHDRYLDTDAWDVWKAGFSLRVRHKGRGHEATLKSLDPIDAQGRVDRTEITEPLATGALEELALGSGAVAARVRELSQPDALGVLFEAWTRRERLDLVLDGESIAEIALDESRLGRTDGPEPTRLTRVEVESRGVARPELEAFVAALRSGCDLTPTTRSKFETGLSAAGLAPAGIEIAPVGPTRRMTAAQAAVAMLRAELATFRAREPGARLGEDAEELHDLRVAARRMHVGLRMYREHLPVRAARLREPLRKLLQALGAARDFDVQIARLDTFAGTLDEEQRSHLEPLRRLLGAERDKARKRMVKALDAPTNRRLLERMERLLQEAAGARRRARPIVTVAPALVRRRYRKLRKTARLLRANPSAETFHEVRASAKKVRYAVEPLEVLYGDRAREFVRTLRRLQNVLGEYQDAQLAARRLKSLAAAKRRKLPGETLFLMGQLAERELQRAQRCGERFDKAFRRIRRRRWKDLRREMQTLEVREQRSTGKARRAARRRTRQTNGSPSASPS